VSLKELWNLENSQINDCILLLNRGNSL